MNRFELKEEHIKLLSNMYTRFEECEFGAPAIDCKRPFGNSTGIYNYMREILDNDYSNKELDKLYKETRTALQIILCTKSFEPGIYVAPEYTEDWSKESDSDE